VRDKLQALIDDVRPHVRQLRSRTEYMRMISDWQSVLVTELEAVYREQQDGGVAYGLTMHDVELLRLNAKWSKFDYQCEQHRKDMADGKADVHEKGPTVPEQSRPTKRPQDCPELTLVMDARCGWAGVLRMFLEARRRRLQLVKGDSE
jgi:hypothetical protein